MSGRKSQRIEKHYNMHFLLVLSVTPLLFPLDLGTIGERLFALVTKNESEHNNDEKALCSIIARAPKLANLSNYFAEWKKEGEKNAFHLKSHFQAYTKREELNG